MSVAGCRDLELLLFGLKNSLRYLTLGAYCYDELLNYVAEMCKNLERLEINSEQTTDMGLVPLFRKLANLRVLDIAACPLVTGICLFEVDAFACTGI